MSAWLLYPTYRYYWQAPPDERADNKLFCANVPKVSHCRKVTLGLDLQGRPAPGHGVVVDKAVSDCAERLAEVAQDKLKDKEIEREDQASDDTPNVLVTLKNDGDEEKVKRHPARRIFLSSKSPSAVEAARR